MFFMTKIEEQTEYQINFQSKFPLRGTGAVTKKNPRYTSEYNGDQIL